jgi:hypothetical protein
VRRDWFERRGGIGVDDQGLSVEGRDCKGELVGGQAVCSLAERTGRESDWQVRQGEQVCDLRGLWRGAKSILAKVEGA